VAGGRFGHEVIFSYARSIRKRARLGRASVTDGFQAEPGHDPLNTIPPTLLTAEPGEPRPGGGAAGDAR
jgi:hypothetical protein